MRLDSKEDRAPYALRMQELRLQARKTQQECANALGIGQPSYAQMEANTMRFRRRDLVTLAALYGMPVEAAFPGVMEGEPVGVG